MQTGVILNQSGKAVFVPAVGQSFREFLKLELSARCERNEYYSLRSFAKNLEIDSSSLSQLISGKRKMSVSMIKRLASKLGLEDTKVNEYVKVQEETKHGEFHSADTRDPEVFDYMSNWKNFAVTDILRLEKGPNTEEAIRRMLGVSEEEMKKIKLRCFRLGLIEIGADGIWKDTAPQRISIRGSLKSGGPNPNALFHQSLLNKANEKLDDQKNFFEGAHFHGHVFTMNQNQVERLRDMLRDFARSIVKEAKKEENHDTVYSLCLDLFPLTNPAK